MKIVIPGGTGQVGQVLARAFRDEGHDVVVVARSASTPGERLVLWDGKTLGAWADEIDGADVVVNLAGRSVNCRYTDANLAEMLASRVDSTRVVGQAIARAQRPPRVWLQMSTATIYAHRFDAPNDEATGVIGGSEPDAPAYWAFSVRIAREWELAQAEAATPGVRKVALRTAMVMSPDPGGIFDVLLALVKKGLGGPVAGGGQYMSWIHDRDFVQAIRFLIDHEEMTGAVNLAAPDPLPQKDFMRALRAAAGVSIGLPATKWMAAIGAWAMGSDTELVLKSRRVVPGRLRDAGFAFAFPAWPAAAEDLLSRKR